MKSSHYSVEIKRKWSNVQKETGQIQNKSIKSQYHCILNDIISKPQHIAKTVVQTISPSCRLDWSLFGVWLSRRMNMLLMAFCAFVVDKNHKQDERIVSKYPLLLTTVLQVWIPQVSSRPVCYLPGIWPCVAIVPKSLPWSLQWKTTWNGHMFTETISLSGKNIPLKIVLMILKDQFNM